MYTCLNQGLKPVLRFLKKKKFIKLLFAFHVWYWSFYLSKKFSIKFIIIPIGSKYLRILV